MTFPRGRRPNHLRHRRLARATAASPARHFLAIPEGERAVGSGVFHTAREDLDVPKLRLGDGSGRGSMAAHLLIPNSCTLSHRDFTVCNREPVSRIAVRPRGRAAGAQVLPGPWGYYLPGTKNVPPDYVDWIYCAQDLNCWITNLIYQLSTESRETPCRVPPCSLPLESAR